MGYMKEALIIAQEQGIENPTLEVLKEIAVNERASGRWPKLPPKTDYEKK